MIDIINELKGYMKDIQDFDKDAAQDATQLHGYLITLTQVMARSNFLMAEYQRAFRKEKINAYRTLQFNQSAHGKAYAPSLAKDYIDAACNESGYVYDLAERCSRLSVHTIDAVRTIISSLKSERSFSNYQ